VHEEDRHSIEDYFAAIAKIAARHPVSVAHLTWKVWGGSRVKTHGHLTAAALNKLMAQDRIRRTTDGLYEPTYRSPVRSPTPPAEPENEKPRRRSERLSPEVRAAPPMKDPAPPASAKESKTIARRSELPAFPELPGSVSSHDEMFAAPRLKSDVLVEVSDLMDRIPGLLARLESEARENNARHDQIRAAHQALTVARDTFHIWSR